MKPVLILLLLISVVFCQDSIYRQETADKILEMFEQRNNVKELFKVWHLIYEKEYNYNTLEGIQKYVTFKKNLKEIQEHNSKNTSYKQGLNHLSDMTYEEVEKFYNLTPMNPSEMRGFLRNLISLDDFNEEDEELAPVQSISEIVDRSNVDLRSIMRPVRNQGSCGSCWAFGTMAAIEGVYNKKNSSKLSDWLSTQQLVDCDTSNKGCNGGWFSGAMNFFKAHPAIYESQYKYTAKKGTCSESSKTKTSIKTTGYSYASNANSLYNLLSNGPVAIAVDANSTFMKYKSGIYSSKCSTSVNHAVVLVGYGTSNKVGYWLIRNSWGTGWGEKGHINIKEDKANTGSCNVERYGYQPKI